MSFQVITYDELEKQNAFIQADIERVNSKALNLKELLTEYIKRINSRYEEIQYFLHSFNNDLVYSDDDKNSLLDIENDIDKLAIELREKKV